MDEQRLARVGHSACQNLGRFLMHEGEEDHIHLDDQAIAFVGERIQLTSVGVDIGSSTSHLVFSYIVLERQGKRLSSRYVVTGRDIRFRSPVIFTPYLPNGLLNARALATFIAECYGNSGFAPEDVDGGAVIATGEAALRDNARAVADLFSREGGKFVCATAGPNLESLLAANGSGAVELSLSIPEPVLNVDIGGGTTKFAICYRGEVKETAAIHLGARLIVWDAQDRISRLEEAGRRLGRAAGHGLDIGIRVTPPTLDAIADNMAKIIVGIVGGNTLPEGELWITPPLKSQGPFRKIVFSGGVAEYIHGRERREFGDLGPRLADSVRHGVQETGAVLLEPKEAIRATCIGASQFTVQLSGDTIFLSHPDHLPLRNIPVAAVDGFSAPSADQISKAIRQALVRLDLEDDGEDRFALALQWRHGADYRSLRALCEAIVDALPGLKNGRPLLLVLDADVAGIVGALLGEEFKVDSVVCIDQVQLREFDYIDIGRQLPGQDVVPVVVKSLVFR